MNVLQPDIVRFGTRRYRKNNVQRDAATSSLRPYEEETMDMYEERRPYEDEPVCGEEEGISSCRVSKRTEAEEKTEECEGIEFGADGNYKCILTIAQSYFGFIIGRNGEKRAALGIFKIEY